MLLELVYIQRVKEATGSLWNIVETHRRGQNVNGREWKVMEPYGSLWKTQECSIGKLCN